jgi:hypothetical protein
VTRHLYFVFALLVIALLVTLSFILRKEMNPKWMSHQEAFFQKERKKVVKALAGANRTERINLQRQLRYLNRPRYKIRQILLKGGTRADRCTTCHIDLKRLEKKHPEIDRFPFAQYGCTVCHGGVGRATEEERAHSTLRIPPRPLYDYLEARGTETSVLDLFQFSASGERIDFAGSNLCLRCHLSSHPRHVARWRKLKFQPFEKVRNKLEELRKSGLELDESRCLNCHTTGFNPRTGRYLEDRVTCENCHGPGEFYADLMAGGRARDGAMLARANILKTRSDRVCLNCHKANRHVDYAGEDVPPTLTAAYLDGEKAPEIDGRDMDGTWDIALETKVPTWQINDGTPQPGTKIYIRAVYSDTQIYFVFRWPDKTRHDRMGQWRFSNGRWQAKAEWPDALSLHWQATAKVDDFGLGGCAVLCHTTGRFKKFPRMATRQEDALVDEWYWNAFVAEKGGRPGDGFLDNQVKFIPPGSSTPPFRSAHPSVSAAHGSDGSGARMPETVGGVPLFLNAKKTGGKQTVPRFQMVEGQRIPSQSSDGGEPVKKVLPLYLSGPPEGGSSADISGGASWSDGFWVLELSRALKTNDKRDAQLDPSEKNYSIGLAVWDGATGNQHQVATVIKLRFEPGADIK